jgi:hypothetical protein
MNPAAGQEVRWRKKVRTAANAVQFIDAMGCCLLFPIRRLPLPSLYFACAQRNIHLGPNWDKYCQLIWGWKDELPRRRRAYYSKCLRGRGMFVSLKLLPQLLVDRKSAFSSGEHELFYAAGRISFDALLIWKALEANGPLATLELRHACRMESKSGNARFKRAMLELQSRLIIVHFGAEQETAAWPSSCFELSARAFPKQAAAAQRIAPPDARAAIACKYLDCHVDAPPATLGRLFGWTKAEALAACGASP